MNKEGLSADLACLLEQRSLTVDKAKYQEHIEQFFIAGAARIDLIAKVIDLDNDIGGYIFDINNLRETSKEISSLANSDSKNNPNLLGMLAYSIFFFSNNGLFV